MLGFKLIIQCMINFIYKSHTFAILIINMQYKKLLSIIYTI